MTKIKDVAGLIAGFGLLAVVFGACIAFWTFAIARAFLHPF